MVAPGKDGTCGADRIIKRTAHRENAVSVTTRAGAYGIATLPNRIDDRSFAASQTVIVTLPFGQMPLYIHGSGRYAADE